MGRRRTKTVAFSSSSTNLTAQGLLHASSDANSGSPVPDDPQNTLYPGQQSTGAAAGTVWGGAGASLHVPMLVGLGGSGGMGTVDADLLCSPVGE